jgi:hypothetical protein
MVRPRSKEGTPGTEGKEHSISAAPKPTRALINAINTATFPQKLLGSSAILDHLVAYHNDGCSSLSYAEAHAETTSTPKGCLWCWRSAPAPPRLRRHRPAGSARASPGRMSDQMMIEPVRIWNQSRRKKATRSRIRLTLRPSHARLNLIGCPDHDPVRATPRLS